MLKNYFKFAFRYFIRRKAFTLINLFGLSLGLCCAFISSLYIVSEFTYDQHFKDSDRIYRLNYHYREQVFALNGFVNWWEASEEEQLIKKDLLSAISGVEEVAHFSTTASPTNRHSAVFVEVDDKEDQRNTFAEKKILLTNTGPDLYRVFGWKMLSGNSQSFSGQQKAILTESTAERYFGKMWQEKIGSRQIYWNGEPYKISGVLRHDNEQSHFDFDLMLLQDRIPSWGAFTYLKLREGVSPAAIDEQIQQAMLQAEPYIADDPDENGSHLQAISDIHFNPAGEFELKAGGNLQYLYIFALVGVIVLLITATNYINLTTALYTQRQREAGMRKVMGAGRQSLRGQLLSEALILSLLSLPPALLIIELLLPVFNRVMSVSLDNRYLLEPAWFLGALGLSLLLGLVSGLYPALSLSNQQVLQLLHKQQRSRNFSLQRAVFVLQFALLITLGIGTVFVNQQLAFIHDMELGFEKDGVVVFDPGGVDHYQRMRQQLQAHPAILAMGGGMVPGQENGTFISYKLSKAEEVFEDATLWEMDWQALEALDITYSGIRHEEAPGQVLLVNPKAANNLQTSIQDEQELIGQEMMLHLEYQNADQSYGEKYDIAGLLDDIHFHSLRQASSPMIIKVSKEPQWVHRMMVRVDKRDLSEGVNLIREAYAATVSEVPLQLEFLDERIAHLYEQEQRIGRMTLGLSVLAILIALLGLVGITAYLVSQRTREIGIRKTMGASVSQILLMLSKEYIFMVLIATLIATPFAYLLTDEWLMAFAYHINISPEVFVLVGLLALIVTVAVVMLQSVRAALAKPAKSMREL